MNFCQVAVKYPGVNLLTYTHKIPLKKGMLVKVPLGRRTADGCIIEHGISQEKLLKTADIEIRPIGENIAADFQLSNLELALYQWMSSYYHYSLGQLIFNSLPRILKRPQKMEYANGRGETLPSLTAEQRQTLASLEPILENKHDKFYLHGITGSGKTFIYLHLIKQKLMEGRSVLFLLPEINLT
ncbi:MAG: DEAD/DEAH box helicase family protein, partial [Halobacteriovoraceae bacterium]|nr:DEAD/DEAH box helicase family protein [Halobacteriovoraceae bacterium]